MQSHTSINEVNKASLSVFNKIFNPIYLSNLIEECVECPFQNILRVEPFSQKNVTFFASYRNAFKVSLKNHSKICEIPFDWFEEKSNNSLTIQNHFNNYNCTLQHGPKPVSNLAIFAIFTLFLWLFLSLSAIKYWYNYLRFRRSESQESPPNEFQIPNRYSFLDCFRGFTILSMIFVNYGGGGYTFFRHKSWFGITFADLIFPFFIFILGMSISISLKYKVGRIQPKKNIINILMRSLKLLVLGIMINSINETSLSKLRIPGVLQRIAICYLIVALTHLRTLLFIPRRFSFTSSHQFKYHFSELLIYWFDWPFAILFTLIYITVTLGWKFSPDCPKGYQGPGGLHYYGKYFNCTGGAAKKLDVMIFGKNHLYMHTSANQIYGKHLINDPEGLLGTCTATLLAFLGLQAGKILLIYLKSIHRIIHWVVWALLLVILMFISLSIFPLCKNLWSFSYVTLSASISFIIVAVLYYLFEYKFFALLMEPLVSVGKNSILIYLGSQVMKKIFPFYFDVDEGSHSWLLIRSFIPIYLWTIIAIILDEKKNYLKL